jgi:hypothetical protein
MSLLLGRRYLAGAGIGASLGSLGFTHIQSTGGAGASAGPRMKRPASVGHRQGQEKRPCRRPRRCTSRIGPNAPTCRSPWQHMANAAACDMMRAKIVAMARLVSSGRFLGLPTSRPLSTDRPAGGWWRLAGREFRAEWRSMTGPPGVISSWPSRSCAPICCLRYGLVLGDKHEVR